MKKRRIRKSKKKIVQVYHDPSEKDIKLARAYGGMPRGAAKKMVTKTQQPRDSQTPGSINTRSNINKVSAAVAGYQRDGGSRGDDRNRAFSSMQNLEEYKENPNNISNAGLLNLNESNEASMLAVPEHHIRE